MVIPAEAASDRFEMHRQFLAKHEPYLRLDVNWARARAWITGKIKVHVGAGVFREFDISIDYRGLDPFALPTVREVGGALPREIDRHIFEDGGFCMWLPQTAPADFKSDDGLALYLERIREFLLLQVMYEDNIRRGRVPAWPGEQWAHGADGHREWVRQEVAGFSPPVIGRMAASAAVPKPGHLPCPCQSGLSIASCHGPWLDKLREAMQTFPGVTSELMKLAGVNNDS